MATKRTKSREQLTIGTTMVPPPTFFDRNLQSQVEVVFCRHDRRCSCGSRVSLPPQLVVPIEQEPWLNSRSGSRALWKLPGRKPTHS